MTVKKTTEGMSRDAALLEIKRRGRKIGSLKRKANRLEDAEIMMVRHERHWTKLQAERESLDSEIATLKHDLRVQTEATTTARGMIRTISQKVDERVARCHRLANHAKYLRGLLCKAWVTNDVFRAELSLSQPSPGCGSLRTVSREGIVGASHEIVGDTLDTDISGPEGSGP